MSAFKVGTVIFFFSRGFPPRQSTSEKVGKMFRFGENELWKGKNKVLNWEIGRVRDAYKDIYDGDYI